MRRTAFNLNKPNWFSRARAERLTREIALLERMDNRLWSQMLGCTIAIILALAAGLLGGAYVLHVHWGLAIAIPSCLAAAAILYGASRYKFGLLWLCVAVVFGVLLVLFFEAGEFPSISGLDGTLPDIGDRKISRKAERQAKVQRAIKNRKYQLEAALRQL